VCVCVRTTPHISHVPRLRQSVSDYTRVYYGVYMYTVLAVRETVATTIAAAQPDNIADFER